METNTETSGGIHPEVRAIATDATHPMHAGYHRGEAHVMAHIEKLYQQATDTTGPLGAGGPKRSIAGSPVLIGPEGINTADFVEQARRADQPATPALTEQAASQDLSLEERAADAEHNQAVEDLLGESKDSELADMQVGYTHLFNMPDGLKVYESFSPMINALGVPGDLWAIRSLAALGRICQEQSEGRRS